MKVLLGICLLVLSAHAFMLLPHTASMQDVRSTYSAFLEGMGVIQHDGLEIGEHCFGAATIEKAMTLVGLASKL